MAQRDAERPPANGWLSKHAYLVFAVAIAVVGWIVTASKIEQRVTAIEQDRPAMIREFYDVRARVQVLETKVEDLEEDLKPNRWPKIGGAR